jgi:hypothetical protein
MPRKRPQAIQESEGTAMKFRLAAALTLALAAGPAYAQQNSDPGETDPYQMQLKRERQEREQNEKDYNVTMKRLKTQGAAKTTNDPWKAVRPSGGSAKQ